MSERIQRIAFDEASLPSRSPEVEHERTVALNDLLHGNSFALTEHPCGPYDVTLRLEEDRLIFDIAGADGGARRVAFSARPLKRLIKDYFLICESYYAALKEAQPHRLEAIDMGRRGVHNEGAEALQFLLEGKVTLDFPTARRLFTLVAVLHLK